MRRLLLVLLLLAGGTLVARGAVPCDALQLQPDCYVSLHPGPTRDTFDLVGVSGDPVTDSTGTLLLTTVAVEGELDLVEWVRGSLSSAVSEVPRRTIFPPGGDRGEVADRNAVLMRSSQTDAAVAALQHLGYDVDERFDGAEVFEVSSPTAVDGDQLQPGDVILAVDDRRTRTSQAVADAIGRREPGDTVELTVRDGDGGRRTFAVELIAAPDEPDRALLGVVLVSSLDLPVDVDIDAGAIGGPSAGLMFALSVIDLLEPADLTGGDVIAGTGTIDRDGRIGAIGGIRQKVIGSLDRSDGPSASVFLVPEGNLGVARRVPVSSDVMLVPVETLDDAVTALRDLREGRPPTDALALSPSAAPRPVRSAPS